MYQALLVRKQCPTGLNNMVMKISGTKEALEDMERLAMWMDVQP